MKGNIVQVVPSQPPHAEHATASVRYPVGHALKHGSVTCGTCQGSKGTYTSCSTCGGDGESFCNWCHGTSSDPADCYHCHGTSFVTCGMCSGSGLTWYGCGNCVGSGMTACGSCSGAKKLLCQHCQGEGMISETSGCLAHDSTQPHYFCSNHGAFVTQYH